LREIEQTEAEQLRFEEAIIESLCKEQDRQDNADAAIVKALRPGSRARDLESGTNLVEELDAVIDRQPKRPCTERVDALED
jgi:hypothetical protein